MTQLKLYRLFFETAGFSSFVPRPNTDRWRAFKSEQSNQVYNNTFNPPLIEPDLYYFNYQFKLKDIMDTFPGLSDGIFVSQKCLEILQGQLRLPPHKIYTIHYKKKSKIVSDYYYVYFYFGLRDNILFEKSYFMIGDSFDVGKDDFEKSVVEKDVQYKDFEHFKIEWRRYALETKLGIDYQKIVFQRGCTSTFDIFPVYLGSESDFYLSQQFIDVFEKEQLTGLDARPFDAFWEED